MVRLQTEVRILLRIWAQIKISLYKKDIADRTPNLITHLGTNPAILYKNDIADRSAGFVTHLGTNQDFIVQERY